MIIRMEAKANVTEEQRKNVSELLSSLRTDELLEDIWYHLKRVDWNTEVPNKRHQKCDTWSREMAKVLHQFYPEVKIFDFERSIEDSEMDEQIVKISELIDRMYNRYVPKRGGEVVISCRRIWEEWKDAEPSDYFSSHQNALTAKIKAVSEQIRGYYVNEGRRVPCKERDPKLPSWGQKWTQQRSFVIRQKTVKTIEYDDDDIIRQLTKWGVQKANAQKVVDVMKKTEVTPENYVEISKKILRKLELLDDDNLEDFIGLFGETETAV
jgi:hypothetical protein